MTDHAGVVFLVDVDNTLLDNDRFQTDLRARVAAGFGPAGCERYWNHFTAIRATTGLADYLAALQDFRRGHDDEPELLELSQWVLEYPFEERLFPGALAALAHVGTLGRSAVLSDGDVVLQPRKVRRAGIWAAVEGRVMIYVHKEQVLGSVQRRYAASHYVMVDDKPNLLAAMKLEMGELLTTVLVRQGQYALAANANTFAPRPDRVIDRIGELTSFNLSDFEVTR